MRSFSYFNGTSTLNSNPFTTFIKVNYLGLVYLPQSYTIEFSQFHNRERVIFNQYHCNDLFFQSALREGHNHRFST